MHVLAAVGSLLLTMSRDTSDATIVQLNEHSRAMFVTYVSWFSFFVTVNFIVAGWFAARGVKDSRESKDSKDSRKGVILVASYFIVQGSIGIVGTVMLRNWYGVLSRQLNVLMIEQGMSGHDYTAIATVMSNYGIYLTLFTVSLATLVVFWILFVLWAWEGVKPERRS